MKVLITLHHGLDRDKGAPGTTLIIADALRAAGHEVSFISFDDLPARVPELVKVLLFPLLVAGRVGVCWLRRDPPDLIEASTGDTWVVSLLPRRLRRSTIAVRSHGLEHVAHRIRLGEADLGRMRLSRRYHWYHGGWRLWEVAFSLRRADVALLLNEVDRRTAVEDLGVAPSRALLIPNALDEDLHDLAVDFTPPEAGRVRIVHIGRYSHEKGMTDASPALEAVLAARPGVEVLLLGTGCETEVVHADFDPTVRPRITVVPAYPRKALAALLAGGHIGLAPSLTEGWPAGVAQMMAGGLAAVVSDNAGAREIVRHGVDGVVVPVGDRTRIERALLDLIDDSEALERFRRASYQRANEFRWADRFGERETAYERAIAETRSVRWTRRRAGRRAAG